MVTMDDKGGGGVRQIMTLADKGGRRVWLNLKLLKKCLITAIKFGFLFNLSEHINKFS